ncbi:MAG TPA: FAD-binding oxidoreductase [Steroidobacteraceae bacterium]
MPPAGAGITLDAAIDRIRQALGVDACLQAPDEVAPYLVDFRGLFRGATRLVALPRSTAEVAAVLAICNEAGIGVVPHGGNTSYCGGATPDASGREIVVAMRRMNRIREVDAANFSITVEAGCVLADVQQAAERAGRLFPLALGSEGSCQIGGNLSTNAGGLAALRYGVARELVLGLEVVLPDGRVLDGLKSLRKDNTGYDLRHLFLGAEGTLGIITAASLKLYPPPRTIATAFVAVAGVAAAVELLGRLRAATGDEVTSFELLPRLGVELAARHVPGVRDPLDLPHDWYVLCEVATSRDDPSLRTTLEETLVASMNDGRVLDATFAESGAQRDAMWRVRESVPEAQRREGASIKHDVSVPVAQLPEFVERATAAVLAVVPGGRMLTYGHVGDGNLHFNVSEPTGGDSAAFLTRTAEVADAVYTLVREFRGSFSAEHGIGRLKRHELARYKGSVDLDLMRVLKRAIDPRGIMNPGKLLPD